jgi:hypothetical protein
VTHRYQTFRSVSDTHVFVICYDGRFDELPDHVRHQGPWQGMQRGEIERLKLEYRLALDRDRYVVVRAVRMRGVRAGSLTRGLRGRRQETSQ